MSIELNLRFPDAENVIVRLGPDDDGSGKLPFTIPLADKDLQDLQWYIETYGANSLGDPDDAEAKRIAQELPAWGKRLFDAVFRHRDAQRRFDAFQDAESDARLLTISAEHPAVLAMPWELLHDCSAPDGTFLLHEQPSISIRRRVAGSPGGRTPFKPAAKDRLHLLFVVSRPDDAGFLDPRADAGPVLDAIDKFAPGRVTCEFLRPPTLDALNDRLNDSGKPPVDILHFDGHGVFDASGNLPNRVAAAEAARSAHSDELLRDKKAEIPLDPDCPPNMGYLVFEKPDGTADFVSADKLGANLHRHKVALVILSACQSAAVGKSDKQEEKSERPMGGVAARLTATGIPSVLAMTHSVLVHTTRTLFGQLYKELAQNKGIGESLDLARRHLANHPEKYEVQRGPDRFLLKLYDWFLPALYQQGSDTSLLKTEDGGQETEDRSQESEYRSTVRSNLPKEPEAGFFGRKRPLWEIERWFAGPTRRITITGFGGQGKTALALEAGRWLTRTGLFRAAVFVDYARIQGRDAVAVTVSNLGSVLGESFPDADAATAALAKTPTLVILDNLEALAPESLRALLDAAVPWSESGGSRVLCTTRRPDFGHAAYRIEGTLVHRRIPLDGLGGKRSPDDALEWFAALMRLPPAPTVKSPAREGLIALFDQVKFHPLSIRVLAQQLKIRRIADVGSRLENLLTGAGQSGPGIPQSGLDEDTPAWLLASLELSLDKLDDAARQVLPRLGVFQGGAMENVLIAITGISEEQWRPLRRQLEAAALVEAEDLSGVSVPFLRFHPTLAPMLLARLAPAERESLRTAHRQQYYALSSYLYQEDNRNPHQARAIAWRELPNLLYAVHAALDAGNPNAVGFADKVNKFLRYFGLKQEAEDLAARSQAAAGESSTRAWLLAQSNRGEQLLDAGQVAEAAKVFQEVLAKLGDAPTYERAVTLTRLGRCFCAAGRPDLAAENRHEAMDVLRGLEQSDGVQRLIGAMLTDEADALAQQGRFAEAREAYLDGLKVDEDLKDLRGQGVTLGQLGTLAMQEGDLAEAEKRHRDALALFQQLREPASEAVAWHQLGRVFEEARQWDEAERHYRESARIKEDNGIITGANGAATTWNQLANVSQNAGRPDATEMWYRKAIEGFRGGGETFSLSKGLSNLADLLRTRSGRLAEARKLAEEALAIKRTLDPGAAEIWNSYDILAAIAWQEAQAASDLRLKAELEAQAREHRRLAREAKRNFAGTRHELRRHAPLILGTVMAVEEPEQRQQLEQRLLDREQHGWTNLVAAIRRILAGERDADALCEKLDLEDSMIVETILAGLADPATLSDLRPAEPPAAD